MLPEPGRPATRTACKTSACWVGTGNDPPVPVRGAGKSTNLLITGTRKAVVGQKSVAVQDIVPD
jgi:hypothetical protein